jgi:hypothetical protein
MSWLLWRQHRVQAYVTALAVVAFGLATVLTGLHMAHVYDDFTAACSSGGNAACGFAGNLFSGYGAIVDTIHLSIALPVVLGVVGATVIGRELEQSTNVLVWTQGVTRRRWVLAKVATALGAAVVTSAAVTALVTWWSSTPNAFYGNRFEGAEFDTQNLVPIAYALFAVGLGLAAGALLRRTLPAIVATVGVFTAVRILVSVYLRPHYLGAVTRAVTLGLPDNVTNVPPAGSWTLSRYIAGPAGPLDAGRVPAPRGCAAVDKGSALQCLGRLGYHEVVKFHPPSQYWGFQWIEAGLFAGLAALLVGIAVVWTLRRDA